MPHWPCACQSGHCPGQANVSGLSRCQLRLLLQGSRPLTTNGTKPGPGDITQGSTNAYTAANSSSSVLIYPTVPLTPGEVPSWVAVCKVLYQSCSSRAFVHKLPQLASLVASWQACWLYGHLGILICQVALPTTQRLALKPVHCALFVGLASLQADMLWRCTGHSCSMPTTPSLHFGCCMLLCNTCT